MPGTYKRDYPDKHTLRLVRSTDVPRRVIEDGNSLSVSS